MSKPKEKPRRRKRKVFYLSMGLVTVVFGLLAGYLSVQIVLSFIRNMGVEILPELGIWTETVSYLVALVITLLIFFVAYQRSRK